MIMNNPPHTDSVLMLTIARVEIPKMRKRLYECVMRLAIEWLSEFHSPEYWQAERELNDFIMRH